MKKLISCLIAFLCFTRLFPGIPSFLTAYIADPSAHICKDGKLYV